jgi:predicted Zn-ribbon and HTH transcriptional regulator
MRTVRHPTADRKGPAIPREAPETVRRSILALLENGPVTALELSAATRRSEKEVLGHLEHLRRSLRQGNRRLEVTPAECRGCGFVFRKRDRVKSPGRCPLCKGESISDPAFRVERGPPGIP